MSNVQLSQIGVVLGLEVVELIVVVVLQITEFLGILFLQLLEHIPIFFLQLLKASLIFFLQLLEHIFVLVILLFQLFGMILLHVGQIQVVEPILLSVLPEIIGCDLINLIKFVLKLNIMILVDSFQCLKMLHFSFSLILLKLLNFRVLELDDPNLFIVLVVMKPGLLLDALTGFHNMGLDITSFVLGLVEGCFEMVIIILDICKDGKLFIQ